MTTYVAFLRAINLGAKRKFPKDDIVKAVTDAGFTNAETHINTGNVRFETTLRSRSRIENLLEAAFLADRGFEIPTIAFTGAELAELAREGASLSEARPGLERHYVYLLRDELPAETAALVEARSNERGDMIVRGRAVHALLGPGYEAGVVDPLGAARLLGETTARNVNVITAIAEKWCR